ncbi:MAG: MMPL family transporter [Gammaproteobacteria bacterium]
MTVSHSWRKRLFFMLLPIAVAVAALTVSVKTDLSAFFVAGDSDEENLLASEMQSGVLSRRYLLSIVDPSGAQMTESAGIDALLTRLQAIAGISDVWRPEQSRAAFDTIARFYAPHAAQLYSRTPASDLDALLSAEGLQRRAEALKTALLSPQAAVFKFIALQDPLLLSLQRFRGMAEQWRESAPRTGPYRNLLLDTQPSGLDAEAQRAIRRQIETQFAQWNGERNHRFRLEMTGVPVFAVATQTMIEGDIARLGALSSAGLVVLFLWLFRSPGALLQVGALLLATMAAAVLATQAVFGYVHGMTLAVGSTLGGVCIDYALHGLVHGQSVPRGERAAVIARIWPSMAMGAVTTSVGYGVLAFSGYPGFRQIAVYAAAAILSALLLTRFVLPSLIVDMPLLKTPPRKGVLEYWLAFCDRHRGKLLIPVLLAIGLAAANLPSLHWIRDLQELTPETDYLKAADQAIRERMISIEPGRFVLISAKDPESALQKAEQVYPRLDRLQAEGRLQNYFGLYPWLLSQRRQQANADLLRRHLTEKVGADWHKALREYGLSVARLGRLDYPDNAPLNMQQLLASPLKTMVDNQVAMHAGQVLLTIWLGEHDAGALQTALSGIDGVRYFSQRDLLNRMTLQYTERASILAAAGIGVIFALLCLAYRRPWPALQTLLPSLSAAVVIAGVWALTGQPLSFLHLTGFLLALSICDDFGIFFRENRGGEIALTYRAMAASMLTSALAFGCLAAAETSMLRTLSAVVGLGVVLGFFLCPVMIKPRTSGAQCGSG